MESSNGNAYSIINCEVVDGVTWGWRERSRRKRKNKNIKEREN